MPVFKRVRNKGALALSSPLCGHILSRLKLNISESIMDKVSKIVAAAVVMGNSIISACEGLK
jgi:hypothetical protein